MFSEAVAGRIALQHWRGRAQMLQYRAVGFENWDHAQRAMLWRGQSFPEMDEYEVVWSGGEPLRYGEVQSAFPKPQLDRPVYPRQVAKTYAWEPPRPPKPKRAAIDQTIIGRTKRTPPVARESIAILPRTCYRYAPHDIGDVMEEDGKTYRCQKCGKYFSGAMKAVCFTETWTRAS